VSLRVLVVDDDLLSVRVLSSILQRHGHEVLTAITLSDALEIVREQGTSLHVALVDYYLDRGNTGAMLVKELPRAVACFLISGYTPEEIRERVAVADPLSGFIGYLAKPLTWDNPDPRHPGLLQWLQRVEKSREDTPLP
jgi:CheY-like chemotaxis protein